MEERARKFVEETKGFHHCGLGGRGENCMHAKRNDYYKVMYNDYGRDNPKSRNATNVPPPPPKAQE